MHLKINDCIFGLKYPSFDHIQDTVFTRTWRNLDLHIPVYMINIGIPVSNRCILFAQVTAMFILYSTNCTRPQWLIAGFAIKSECSAADMKDKNKRSSSI